MKRKRNYIIQLLILAVMLAGSVTFVFADADATLYTGGGAVKMAGWSMNKDIGVARGTGNLPIPTLNGADFKGWYDNAGLSGNPISEGTAAAPGGKYYAKWQVEASYGAGDTMSYQLTKAGGTAMGKKDGAPLKAFFGNGGFYTYEREGSIPAGGSAGAENYVGNPVAFGNDELFTPVGTNGLYLGRTMTLSSGMVRLTYVLQNRGASAVSGFNLGVVADSMLGANDFVPLRIVSEEGDTYLQMLDTAAGNELRMYYKGDSVSDVSRFWYGGYQPYANHNGQSIVKNVFNNGKDVKYKDGIDSAFALSWNNISVGAGETKTYSVLLGVGKPGTMIPGCSVSYISTDSKTENMPVDQTNYGPGAATTIKPQIPVRKDFTFKGWSENPGGKGKIYSAGERIIVEEDLMFYAVWEPIPHKLTLQVLIDGQKNMDSIIKLVGVREYDLVKDEANGVYVGEAVISGSYMILMDGNGTGKYIPVMGEDKEHTLEYGSAKVRLTLDDAFMTGKTVAIYDKGVRYGYLEEKDDIYQNKHVPVGSYDLKIDGVDYGKLTTGTQVDLEYFTAKILPKKDGALWGDGRVTLTRGEKIYETQLRSGVFTAVLPKDSYELKVNDMSAGVVTENAVKNVDFYTVTFMSGSNPYTEADLSKPQVVLSGSKAVIPLPPSKGDATFEGWKTTDGGTADFSFDTTITETTKVYDSWSIPYVSLGEIQKKSDTTYSLTDPRIYNYPEGYQVKSIKIEVSSGSAAAVKGSGDEEQGSGSKSVTIVFGTPKSIDDAEIFIKEKVTFTMGSEKQKIVIKTFASSNS